MSEIVFGPGDAESRAQGSASGVSTDRPHRHREAQRPNGHAGQRPGESAWLVQLSGWHRVRFADQAAAEGWYNDPEYQKVLPLPDQAYTVLEINMFQE